MFRSPEGDLILYSHNGAINFYRVNSYYLYKKHSLITVIMVFLLFFRIFIDYNRLK